MGWLVLLGIVLALLAALAVYGALRRPVTTVMLVLAATMSLALEMKVAFSASVRSPPGALAALVRAIFLPCACFFLRGKHLFC